MPYLQFDSKIERKGQKLFEFNSESILGRF